MIFYYKKNRMNYFLSPLYSLLYILLLHFFITPITSDCLANFNPSDIYSSSFLASTNPQSSPDFPILSFLNNFLLTFPYSFSSSPQASIGISQLSSFTLPQSPITSLSILSKTNQKSIQISISVSPVNYYKQIRINFIVSLRNDLELGSFTTTRNQIAMKQFNFGLRKSISNPVSIPFLSGYKMERDTRFNTPCYFKIVSNTVSGSNIQLGIDANGLSEVSVSYIIYDSVNLKKQYKVLSGALRLNNTVLIDSTVIDSGTTHILGINSFIAHPSSSSFTFSSSFLSHIHPSSRSLKFQINISSSSSSLLDLSISYLIIETSITQYCKKCSSGSIISDKYCVSQCSAGEVMISEGGVKMCVLCDIGKYMVQNQLKTGCVCAVQSYFVKEKGQCRGCYEGCLTCKGEGKGDCLSCVDGGKVDGGECRRGFLKSQVDRATTITDLSSVIPIPYMNKYTPSRSTIPPPIVCGPNQTLSPSSNKCICLPNFFNISNNCIPCPPTQYFNSFTSRCSDCFNGTISADQLNCICLASFFLINNLCQSCPLNSYYNGIQCKCHFSLVKFNGLCLRGCPMFSWIKDGQCFCAIGYVGVGEQCKKVEEAVQQVSMSYNLNPGYLMTNNIGYLINI